MHWLTAAEKARLESLPDLWRHVGVRRYFYLDIARKVRILISKHFPHLESPNVRIHVIALFIKETDPDIWGLERGGLTIPEMCTLFAKTVLDHESDPDEE